MKTITLLVMLLFLWGCSTLQQQQSCIPTGIEHTPMMDKRLTLKNPRIPLEMVISVLNDFLDYRALRPDNAGMERLVSINYTDMRWIDIFHDICETHALTCAVSDGVIYAAPTAHLEESSKQDCFCH